MTNPEDAVVSAIDDLVDWQLDRAPRSNHNETCHICAHSWHGLDNGYCPGAFATQEQIDTRTHERAVDAMEMVAKNAQSSGRTLRQAIITAFAIPEDQLPKRLLDATTTIEAADVICETQRLRERTFHVDGNSRNNMMWLR